MRLAGVQVAAMSPLVAGMRPAKSCKDASPNERIVYSTTKSEGQMAVCSVPPGTFHPLHIGHPPDPT